MARRQRDLDPAGGPVVDLAAELRALRARAGDPKFATMARRTGRSKTALSEAAGGRRLPRWDTVEDFVRACDGDPSPWRARWLEVRAAVDGQAAAGPDPGTGAPGADVPEPGVPEPGVPEADVPDPGVPEPDGAAGGAAPAARATPGPRPRRLPLLVVGAAVAVVVAGVGGFAAGRATAAPEPWEVPLLRAIEVQNKVALGRDRLVEDRTPVYLSTLPVAYCAAVDRGCKVPGTEVGSGAALVAHCVSHGQQMWNYDLQDPEIGANPDRAASDLWYRASFPDGRVGYLSEVYLTGGSRGGLGLTACEPAVDRTGP